jgi:peptidoglycan/xylan/chitin deacetylase (PgdA/CDA1 family)
VAASPLEHFIDFWKPLMDGDELRSLAVCREPGDAPVPGLNVWRPASEAKSWRVSDGDVVFSIFAAVHPIAEIPPSSEVLAEILDPDGAHHSYVLWLPAQRSVIVPFDPSAAAEAFRREDYVPSGQRTALPRPLLTLYYAIAKPLLSQGIKRRMRRSMAHRALASEHALGWPSDESLDALQRLMLRIVLMASGRQQLRFTWFWPDGHPWAAILTHDVETAQAMSVIPRVAEMEAERGLRSSFNFVPLDYDTPEPLLQELREGGFEIGVHGDSHDGLLFSSWSAFKERVVAVNEAGRRWKASGFRSPATYRNPEWMHLLEFEYDSSYSNTAPCEPQPGGCGSFFPFPVDGLIELPITLPQDHTLYELLEQTDASTWLSVLERIRQSHGMACVLTHPDPAAGYLGSEGIDAHYGELLDSVASSGAWTPLPRDLARWWRTRAATPPDRAGSVEGMSYGSAVLGDDGELEIVAPSRSQAAQPPPKDGTLP